MTIEEQEDIELRLEEDIQNWVADFLTTRVCEPALVRLLTTTAGSWQYVEELFETDNEYAQQLQTLQQRVENNNGTLFTTWLPYPPDEEEYVVILFFMDWINYDTSAIYNKSYLMSKQDQPA